MAITPRQDQVGSDLLEAGIPPLFPPQFLAERVLPNLGGVDAAADAMNISPRELREILAGRKKIDVQVADRLATVTEFRPAFWTNLQEAYDLFHR